MPVAITNQDHAIMRDVTVYTVANLPAAGTAAGTAVAYLAVIETIEISLKREYADTTGSADFGKSSRAVRWGEGSVRMAGFSQVAGSKFASLFAQGGHALLNFQEAATGDVYQLVCRCEELSKSLGKEATKDSLTLQQEGVPFYAPAAGILAAMVLE